MYSFGSANRQCLCKAFALLLCSSFLNVAVAQNQSAIVGGETFFDPTQPSGRILAATADSDIPAVNLSALLNRNFNVSFVRAGGTNPVAVINNQRVSIGDQVSGALVTEINAGSVTLLINGQERVVTGFMDTLKSPVEGASEVSDK